MCLLWALGHRRGGGQDPDPHLGIGSGSTAMAAGVMVGGYRAGHHIVLVAYMLGVFH